VLLLGVSSSHEEKGGEGGGEGEGEEVEEEEEEEEEVEVAAVVMALWFLNLKEVTMLVMIMLLDCHIRKSSAKLLDTADCGIDILGARRQPPCFIYKFLFKIIMYLNFRAMVSML
jgi:hypothetical protein